MPRSRLMAKLMAANPQVLKSRIYPAIEPPTAVYEVAAPWMTRPTRMKKPAMNSPVAMGCSPIRWRS